jgi:uncharacterized protein HemY
MTQGLLCGLWLAQAGQQQLEIDWGDYRLGLAVAFLVLAGIIAYVVVLYFRDK